jgi:flagellar FliJ protein
MQTLLLLLRQAESERDAALAAHEQAQRAERASVAQLQQLTDYRADYETRWNAQFSQGGEMALVRCYHDFMARLSQAVDQQHNAVRNAQAQRQAALQGLRERELRVASVGKLIERRSREIRIGSERRDQRQFDEMAARLVRIAPLGMDFVATR